ncbi:non-hem dioxygenase in morphine synthesis N-terminal [Phytophthora infestans]|uniref:Non-hem dioxygenase in morphine synthesis N-terminal n=1 Tax=Phytophthora infestans TaxID=4787 RepID=A0A8S9VAD5_PHYIN|nr:non-hem dioxygenase in morphine synthesis N-terminal [Phytophthora infestans]KAF4149940.1 non-hem dioxygenase in morphine synthesis N-terminal [Phytophthora infestans]
MDVRQVPVIDIGTLIGPSTDAEVDAALRDSKQQKLGQIVDSVRKAASEWGFFYIANHGFNWRQFQLNRQQGNYADVGKENQIGDFKIHGPIDVANA